MEDVISSTLGTYVRTLLRCSMPDGPLGRLTLGVGVIVQLGCGGTDAEPDNAFELGPAVTDCAPPEPAVLGTVAYASDTARAAFDVRYLSCAVEPVDGEELCQSLATPLTVALHETVENDEDRRRVCTYNDESGLRITLPSVQFVNEYMEIQLPGRGTDSLVDCYEIVGGDLATGQMWVEFPHHEQQDYRTHSGAQSGAENSVSSRCGVQIKRDERTARDAAFRVSGIFTCTNLLGTVGEPRIDIAGRQLRYEILDASFDLDCWYELTQ